jgi:hypothetical protein
LIAAAVGLFRLNTGSVCQLQFEALAIVVDEGSDAVMLGVVSRGDWVGCCCVQRGDGGAGNRFGCAIDLDGKQIPPRRKRALPRGDGHDESLRGKSASEKVAEIFSFFEVVAQSVVKVNVAAASVSGGRWWVDTQGERAFRFSSVL